MKGFVYTETVVYAPPETYRDEAPYQIAIVTLENGRRLTARIVGERVAIGDTVSLREDRDGVLYFCKA